MIRQSIHEVKVKTTACRGFYDLTDSVQNLITAARLNTGLATLHVQHTSASLLIQENADPEVRRDLERFFSKLVIDGDRLFRHTSEGDDDMPAHVRSALTSVNLSVPIARGLMVLGTWQAIYLWEHRTACHDRRIIVHLFGE
jgi:secondary thiamine-phosphate synthase enzyme